MAFMAIWVVSLSTEYVCVRQTNHGCVHVCVCVCWEKNKHTLDGTKPSSNRPTHLKVYRMKGKPHQLALTAHEETLH